MKVSVCLVCLKTFNSDGLASKDDGNEEGLLCGAPLLTRFLKFTENYLNLGSVTTQQLLLSGEHKEAFCEKCELSVINPICQVYMELLSAQLRLSSELDQLGKLLDNSKVSGSDKLRVLNINALSHQLGIRSLSQLEGFRTSLAQKCLLTGKQASPYVVLTSRSPNERTGIVPNDESSFPDNLQNVWENPLAREASDNNSLDLEQEDLKSIEKKNEEGNASVIIPIGTLIKFETFHQDSNPELIFENENDEAIDDSPSGISELGVIPVAEPAGIRINGVYYNGRRCPKCLKVSKNEKQFELHYRYYHLAITCNSCGKTFGNKRLLRTHFNRYHRQTGVHTCQLCSKVYDTAYRLNDHIRRVHTNEQRHCPHCEASFRSNTHLEQHIVAIHKPGHFTCPHCPESKVFTTSKYLRGHIRQIHPQFFVHGKPQSTSVQTAN